MVELALALAMIGFIMGLISTVGLIWAISEVKGFQKSKYSVMYPSIAQELTEETVKATADNGILDNAFSSMYDETI